MSRSPPCHFYSSPANLFLCLYLTSISMHTQVGYHPYIFSFQQHCSAVKSRCWFLLLYFLKSYSDYLATCQILAPCLCCRLGICHACCIWWTCSCILLIWWTILFYWRSLVHWCRMQSLWCCHPEWTKKAKQNVFCCFPQVSHILHRLLLFRGLVHWMDHGHCWLGWVL